MPEVRPVDATNEELLVGTYKEFNTVNQLFQFAMLAEKELQGREQ